MKTRAFSLLEVMVAVAILSVLMLVTISIIDLTSRVWRSTSAMTGSFRESRAAFESITRRLSQATLNPYFDYVDSNDRSRAELELTSPGATFIPRLYKRQSELHFVTGPASDLLSAAPGGSSYHGHGIFFQAPLGFSDDPSPGDAQLVNLLNATGYFIQRGSDAGWKPAFLNNLGVPSRTRYRLMQFVQSTESLTIYGEPPTSSANRYSWFRDALGALPSPARPIADNVVLVVFTPLDPGGQEELLTDDYQYDSKAYLFDPNSSDAKLSRNQLPPAVRVTLVGLDEVAATRMEELYPGGPPPYLAGNGIFIDPSKYHDDLRGVVDGLSNDKLTHRVFSTAVVIRQSKFSRTDNAP